MDEIEQPTNLNLNTLNLWDLEVTSIRLFRPVDTGRPSYDLDLTIDIRPGTLAPNSPRQNARFRFYECIEFGAAIDVRMWTMLGPELATGRAVAPAVHSEFTRYTLELRPPSGSLEVVAKSFSYEGPELDNVPESARSITPG
jgi:hypothetical protein